MAVLKMVGWNVNGIRASMKKGFADILYDFDADIFCVQETKAQDDQVDEALKDIKGYHLYRTSAVKKGYSGTAVLTKQEPINVAYGIGVEEHDQEGRVTTLEFENFYFTDVYVPNSGSGLKRLDYRAVWDKAFADYLHGLNKMKPLIITGDFNVAHQAIDLARPKENYNKTSGYTQKEIDGLDYFLKEGFVDTYRVLNPEGRQYTFWNQRFRARDRGVGWRIDYFFVPEHLMPNVKSALVHDDVMGSDHCPVSIEIEI